MFLQRFLSWRPFSDVRVWLFAVVAGYMYFVEIAPNWTTFRYKMTVEIETPEGVKTGSSVVEYVRRPTLNAYGIATMLFSRSTREGTLLRAQHWTRGLATIIEIGPAGWVVIPRIWAPFAFYKIQPDQLNSSLPKITVPYGDGFAAMWVPPNGKIVDGYHGVAGELKRRLEGVSITKITVEPTSDALLAKVPPGSPAWLDDLRARRSILNMNPRSPQYGVHVSEFESGW